jgi:hypothetical protein
MSIPKSFLLTRVAPCSACAWLFFSAGCLCAQTYDFGYVPLGTTNKANGFNFAGSSYNGTNLSMASESMTGPYAADFPYEFPEIPPPLKG